MTLELVKISKISIFYLFHTCSLGTLEASITDQSSLSKLVEIKDNKISGLQSAMVEREESLADLENQ